jgi:hypothetical protein
MKNDLNNLEYIKKEAINSFNNKIVKNNSPNDMIFEEIFDKNKSFIFKIDKNLLKIKNIKRTYLEI